MKKRRYHTNASNSRQLFLARRTASGGTENIQNSKRFTGIPLNIFTLVDNNKQKVKNHKSAKGKITKGSLDPS